MEVKTFKYSGYLIEIHEHPIYKDFEFVVKTLDGHEVKGTSTHPYQYLEDAENAATIFVSYLTNL